MREIELGVGGRIQVPKPLEEIENVYVREEDGDILVNGKTAVSLPGGLEENNVNLYFEGRMLFVQVTNKSGEVTTVSMDVLSV